MRFIPTPQQEAWMKSRIEAGDYDDINELIGEAIREKMERNQLREIKLRDLQAAISEGLASPARPFNIEEIIASARERRAQKRVQEKNV